MDVFFALYLLAVIQDGDYLNDWLTHLPAWSSGAAQLAGWTLALVLGY